MTNESEVTYRKFEPKDLEAARLLSYQSDDYIHEDQELFVAVRNTEVIACAGITMVNETDAELKPLLIKIDEDELTITEHFLVLAEKLAKVETIKTLVVNVLREQESLQTMLESHGFTADPLIKAGRTKFIPYSKELNYFRQHDLGL